MNRKSPIVAIIVLGILFIPIVTLAQTTSQVRQNFNPNASINLNSTYGGVTFSGVGGAIASCANVGGLIQKGISSATSSIGSLFKNSGAAAKLTGGTAGKAAKALGVDVGNGQNVPVDSKTANDQLKQENQRENCLNGVAYAIEKSILAQVTGSMLNWVNTGFNGGPLYIRDINSYLSSLADEQTARVVNRLPVDDPVFGTAIRSIITEQISGVDDNLINKTMNTPAGKRYEQFQEDFTNGGWDAFLNPENNPIEAIFKTSHRLSQAVTTEQDNAKAELERNNGFLDMKKCAEWDAATTTQQQTSQAAGQAALNARLTQIAASKPPTCTKWETVTPGSVVAAQINEVTTSPIRQLEQADQINEVLGSFFDQLLNRLISNGLSSIKGKRGSALDYGGLGSNIVIGSNGQPLSGVSAQDILGYQLSNTGNGTNDFDISRPQQLRAILQAQYDYLNRALDSRAAMDRIVPTLGALDYCIPGPNPTWQNGLQDNINTYFGNLQEVQKDTMLGRRLLQSIPIIGSFFSGSSESHTIAAVGTELFDKAIDTSVTISDTAFHEDNRSAGAIFNNVKLRFDEVMDFYKNTFTQDNIKNAFVAADPNNSAYASGFVETAFTETSKLTQYDQAIGELDDNYASSEKDTRAAIAELESIRSEVNDIVSNAKARYIAEQKAAGTPVNLSCINEAYKIDTSPIVPVARQESDTPSPFRDQSVQGANYFYSHL